MNWVMAWLTFVGGVSLSSYGFALISGELHFSHAGVAVLLSVFISGIVFFRYPAKGRLSEVLNLNFVEQVLLVFLIATVLFHSMYLIYDFDDQVRTLHKNNYGDLSMHVGMIRYLAEAGFLPENPIFIGDDLDYPAGMNMFNAVFEKLGVPTFIHLRWTMLLSSIILILLCWQLGGPLFVSVVFFAASGSSFFDGGPIEWKNFFLSLWITQRGFLFALPVGILACHEMFAKLKDSRPPDPVVVLLVSLLAFFHLHTLIACCLLWGLFTIIFVRKNWIMPLFAIGLFSLPFIWNSTDGLAKSSVVHWQAGWLFKGALDVVRNLGPFPAFFVAAIGWAVANKKREAGLIAAIFLFWVVFFNLMLAPWAWDNMKILIWPFLALSLYICLSLRPHLSTLRLSLLVPLFLFGIVEIYQSWPIHKKSVSLVSVRELNQWSEILHGIDKNSRIATFPTFNHPVSFLGHAVVMGYPGHLWSHGISYLGVEHSLKEFYSGRGQLEDVKWIALGSREKSGFNIDKWTLSGKLIKENRGASLYEHSITPD